MEKKRLTVEKRLLIEQLLKLNYKLKDIAEVLETDNSTVSREIKKRRICGAGNFEECKKLKRYPYVCNNCKYKYSCKKKRYYYNYKKAQSNYEFLLVHTRKGIDMTVDEIDYWNDYFEDKIKNKNQPITHIFNNIKGTFPKSIQTFYNYVHNGYFSSINDEMLARSYSYKPRKRSDEKPTIRCEAVCRNGRNLKDMANFIEDNPNSSIVEMDTVIGKFEDKKCILTLYFRESKLMLMFLVNKYKPASVKKVFDTLKKDLGINDFKRMFKIILTDNGWEFSKPEEIEYDINSHKKLSNVFFCDPYSSWQKGGIERNHEFIRYIIPKGISFDSLTKQNIIDMMNNINNINRRSLENKTSYELFNKKYGDEITKKLHLTKIQKDEVNLSYKILK